MAPVLLDLIAVILEKPGVSYINIAIMLRLCHKNLGQILDKIRRIYLYVTELKKLLPISKKKCITFLD